MADAVKTTREPGWYWVRPLDSEEWEVAQWHRWRGSIPETSGASWWRAVGTPLLDGDCAEIDERRITRPPAPGDVAEAVKWANTLEQHSPHIYDRLTPKNILRLDVLAAAAERAPTEAHLPAWVRKGSVVLLDAQVREIAEAWAKMSERYGFMPHSQVPTIRRVQDALRAAGIIGGEHG